MTVSVEICLFVLRTDHLIDIATLTPRQLHAYIPRVLLKDQPRGGTMKHKLAWPYLIHQRSESWVGTTNPATSSHNIVSTHQYDCHLLVPIQLQTIRWRLSNTTIISRPSCLDSYPPSTHRSDDSACWKSALAHRVIIVDDSILRLMNISNYLASLSLPPLQPFTVKYNALAYWIPSVTRPGTEI
jgi:hypothetical protein